MAWCPSCGPVPTSDCDQVRRQGQLVLVCLSCRSTVSGLPAINPWRSP